MFLLNMSKSRRLTSTFFPINYSCTISFEGTISHRKRRLFPQKYLSVHEPVARPVLLQNGSLQPQMISHVMPKLLGLFFARTCLEQVTSRKETLSFAECPRGSTRNFDAWESEFYRIPMESSPECKACVFGKKLIFKSMIVSLI